MFGLEMVGIVQGMSCYLFLSISFLCEKEKRTVSVRTQSSVAAITNHHKLCHVEH